MSNLTSREIRDLASWLDVPISGEEIDEVTAKYNASTEAIAQLDESLWQDIDPIPWVADVEWSDKDSTPEKSSQAQAQPIRVAKPIDVTAPLTVADLSNSIRKKDISPVEVAQAYLARIDAVDSKVHGFITITGEEALSAAKKTEAEILKGNYRGPLHGIPIGIKDQIFTKGIKTTTAQPYGENFVPDYDATVVARLKEAGAVLMGKLNLTVIGGGGRTYYPYGIPTNPWNLDYSAGGSSGGSGIAVAACELPITIGEDSLGSIRGPASYCGIVGLKTTHGRVSRHGMTDFDWSLDTIGPMGRTVLDCAWLLEAIAGHDPSDITTSRRPVPHYEAFLTGDIAGTRVGVVKELLYHEEIDVEMRDAVLAAVKALNDQGAKVEEVSLPNIQYIGVASGVADQVNNVNLHLARFKEHPELYDYATRTRFLTAALMPASVVSVAYRLRNLIRRDVLGLLSKFDVLVYPGAAGPAPKITPPSKSTNKDDILDRMLNSPNLTSASNLVGAPSIVLPCGFSSTGLPLGLQITGGMFQESTVFRVAHAYQAMTDWHLRVAEL